MIVWINCKISDKRWTPIGNKGNLKTDNRLDIAKYFFASLSALSPIISKLLVNIELEEPYNNKGPELKEWISSLFPAEKLGTISWYRCNNLEQWKKVQEEIDSINDDTLYIPGAEDHIFMDSTIDLWKRGLDLIRKDSNFAAVYNISHYPEMLSNCIVRGSTLSDCGKFTYCFPYDHELSSNFILKKDLFHKYLEYNNDPNKFFFRIEDFKIFWPQTLYMATKEVSRHYDGYTHVHMDLNICPPLEIPKGFFEKKIIIRYGFEDRDPACVNINPMKQNLYSVDINGTDYKWTLADIPLFWKPYIKEIIIASNIDHDKMIAARNQHYVNLSRAPVWGRSAAIPESWTHIHNISS